MAKSKSTPVTVSTSSVDDHLLEASEKVLRARAMMELLESMAGADGSEDPSLKLDDGSNPDVLVTTLGTIRGFMQEAEREIEAAMRAAHPTSVGQAA